MAVLPYYMTLPQLPRLGGQPSQLPSLVPGTPGMGGNGQMSGVPGSVVYAPNMYGDGGAGMLANFAGDVTGGPTGSALPPRRRSLPRLPRQDDAQAHQQVPAAGVSATVSDPDLSSLRLDAKTPTLPHSDGMLGGDYDPNTGITSWLGGAVTYKPQANQTDTDRLGLAGATLKDVALWLGGNGARADNVANAAAMADKEGRQRNAQDVLAATQKVLMDSNATVDQKRAALAQAAAAGVDTDGLIAAQSYGAPSLKAYSPDQMIVATDPITGRSSIVRQGVQRPVISGGQQWDPATGAWSNIPGYGEQQIAIARAKAAASAAAKAGASQAAGAMQLPQNPAYMFRSR